MNGTRYFVCIHNGSYPVEMEVDCLPNAERFMRSEGFVPTWEQAPDAEDGGELGQWEGYCDYWTAEGRMLDSYPQGQEPRIRVLHPAGDRDVYFAE